MIVKVLFLFSALALSHVKSDVYDDKVMFTVSMESKSVLWSHTNTTLTSLGCDKNGKFAIFTHGWRGAGSEWAPKLNANLLKYRGGCVIYMDWGEFAKNLNYWKVRYEHWPKVADLMKEKLVQMKVEGIDPAKIYMYGHSLGARMVIEAALNFGPNQIGMIDACDPAGPEFNLYDARVDTTKAAKNIQVIHTSIDAGTLTRNIGHQNILMGECGISQPASKTLKFLCQQSSICPYTNATEADISHNLCNDFYNNAFEYPFLAKNINCLGCRNIKDLPSNYKMGYDETKTSTVRGMIAVPTSKDAPYNVV